MKAGQDNKEESESRRDVVARDVAIKAGVSTATVSRVLNGTAKVNQAKRDAVLKAAAELGFVANGAARALSLKRFMTVGAVIPNLENEEFLRALSAFHDRLRLSGYTLQLTQAGYDLDLEMREAGSLLGRGLDGLLLIGDIHHPQLIEKIERRGVELVQIFSLSEKQPCVGFDNAAASRRATQFLLDLGHRRIGMVTGDRTNNDRTGARAQGIKDAVAAVGLSVHPAHDITVYRYADRTGQTHRILSSYGIAAGRDGVRHILAADAPRPTAIICGTDQLAFGAMIEAQAQGLRVPEDISIIGFNDADYAAFLSPALTTLRIHAAEIGRAAGDYLVGRMTGLSPVRITEIPAELIVRSSTAPPPSDK